MGYLNIENLYRNTFLLTDCGPELYALNKIHGTSAHISWNNNPECNETGLKFFSGGEKHDNFIKLFDIEKLVGGLCSLSSVYNGPITIYGEAYGGKQQKMSATYGPNLRFVAFDVKVGDTWLDVPDAHEVVKSLGLDFVDYARGPATKEWVDSQRDLPCRQAKRNGILEDKVSEGVVLRPINEMIYRGSRVIAKHKTAQFSEHGKPREVSAEKLKANADAQEVANDWVTEQRLIGHVLPKLNPPATELKDTPRVILAIREDIKKESEGEIVWSDAVDRAIGSLAAKLYKKYIKELQDENLRTANEVSIVSEANNNG